jgi:hypothetical protein
MYFTGRIRIYGPIEGSGLGDAVDGLQVEVAVIGEAYKVKKRTRAPRT